MITYDFSYKLLNFLITNVVMNIPVRNNWLGRV